LTQWIVSHARHLSTEEVTDVCLVWLCLVYHTDCPQLVNRRNALRQQYFGRFSSLCLDVILCPASPAPALPFHSSKYWSYSSLFNFLDWPAAVFPTGIQVTLCDRDEGYTVRNEDERHLYQTCELATVRGRCQSADRQIRRRPAWTLRSASSWPRQGGRTSG
jgi:hypothetical protein